MDIRQSFKKSELTLYRGTHLYRGKILILVAKDLMAVSTDSGDTDSWVLKKGIEITYVYEPLDLSNIENLTRIW